jgi:hypothetical protein
MRKDRSCSAGLLEFPPATSSPDPTRRNKDKLLGQPSSSRLRPTPHATLVDLTIFHIPGMDVKLHYTSKVVSEEEQLTQSPDFERAFSKPTSKSRLNFDESEENRIEKAFKRQDSHPVAPATKNYDIKMSSSLHGITNPNYGHSPTSSKTSLDDLQFGGTPTPPHDSAKSGGGTTPGHRKAGIKKASLFAWMTLQSVPEETIISPHILEFLEQTLEPIPAKTSFSTTGDLPDDTAVRPHRLIFVFALRHVVPAVRPGYHQLRQLRLRQLPRRRHRLLPHAAQHVPLQLPAGVQGRVHASAALPGHRLQLETRRRRTVQQRVRRRDPQHGRLRRRRSQRDRLPVRLLRLHFPPLRGQKVGAEGGAVVAAVRQRAQGLALDQRRVRQVPPVQVEDVEFQAGGHGEGQRGRQEQGRHQVLE